MYTLLFGYSSIGDGDLDIYLSLSSLSELSGDGDLDIYLSLSELLGDGDLEMYLSLSDVGDGDLEIYLSLSDVGDGDGDIYLLLSSVSSSTSRGDLRFGKPSTSSKTSLRVNLGKMISHTLSSVKSSSTNSSM